MKLPNAEQATVERAKVQDYLLNPAHPDGWGKARFFASVGFRREKWDVLATELIRLARECSVVESRESAHGEKYVVDGLIGTPSEPAVQVRTIWIVDAGTDAPRLVSAYPKEKKDQV